MFSMHIIQILILGLLISLASSVRAQISSNMDALSPNMVMPLDEDMPVGPYQQPEWTTARRFPTTRVYLQQLPWQVGVEQWVKAQWPRGENGNYLFQEEVEVG